MKARTRKGQLSDLSLARRWAVCASAAVLLVTLIPSALGAQEMVLHRFTSVQPDPQVEEVLYLAAGVALVQAGLSSTREEGSADYVLAAEYASGKDGTEVQYALYRPASPQSVLAEITVDLPVDETFDAAVETAVNRLLQTAGIQGNPSLQASIEGLLPAAPAASDSNSKPDTTVEEGTKPDATAGEATKPGLTVDGRGSPGAGVTETPAPAPSSVASRMSFDSSVSAAGVLLFGAITQFLHYGAGGLLRAGVSWPQKSWRPTLGAAVSLTRAFNDNGVVGGPLYLSTVGVMLQAGTGTSSAYLAAVALSGGAAMITVQTAAGLLTQTAPYADAALQFTIPVGRRVSMGIDVRFFAVFANEVTILAVAPAITARAEL